MILYIIGTKGFAPIKESGVKKYTQCRIVSGKNNITIDAGNVFKHPANLVLITHLDESHLTNFHTVPKGTLVWAPHRSFIPILRKMNPRVKLNLIRPSKTTKYKKFKITPFRVLHNARSKTYAFRIEAENKKFVWAPDTSSFIGTSKYLKNLDYLFLDSSSLKKNRKKHQSLINSLSWLKSQEIYPKKIFTIHYGIGMTPLKSKIKFAQKSFPGYNVNSTYDGKLIKL